jgi:hypothetical protein
MVMLNSVAINFQTKFFAFSQKFSNLRKLMKIAGGNVNDADYTGMRHKIE